MTEQPNDTKELAHVKSIDALEEETHAAFDALVDKLLKNTPKVGIDQKRWVAFKFNNSDVLVLGVVGHDGSLATHTLRIITPIIVADIETVSNSYPNEPYEITTFKSHQSLRALSIDVEAFSRLSDMGREITLEQYTAGGLLSPINTKGKGRIEAFKNVIALFQNVDLQRLDHLASQVA